MFRFPQHLAKTVKHSRAQLLTASAIGEKCEGKQQLTKQCVPNLLHRWVLNAVWVNVSGAFFFVLTLLSFLNQLQRIYYQNRVLKRKFSHKWNEFCHHRLAFMSLQTQINNFPLQNTKKIFGSMTRCSFFCPINEFNQKYISYINALLTWWEFVFFIIVSEFKFLSSQC